MRACDHLPERFNAAEWAVGRHAADAARNVAIVTDEKETTYGELDQLVRRFASALTRHGVHPGDRVALILPEADLFSTCFWGAIAAGAVAVPVNPLLKPGKLKAILTDCDPRVLVFDGRLVEGAAVANEACARWEAAAAASRVREVRIVDENGASCLFQ